MTPILPQGVNLTGEAAQAYADRFQLSNSPGAQAFNRERQAKIRALLQQILKTLAGRFDIVILKGFTHAALFHIDPATRVQYDLDLFSPEHTAAIKALLPRPSTGYKWKGDFYDPAIPIEIDFHDRLWDARMEGFPAPGIEEFWQRRIWTESEGLRFQTLAPPDAVGFAALHMLKHILHGDARPAHALEMASFLRHHPEDHPFWREWRKLHPQELRRIEALSFRFANEWFGCPTPSETREFPPAIENWFNQFATSPIAAFFRPNKDELALNLLLIESPLAKARVTARRLMPLQWPHPFSYALQRGLFHLRSLLPALSTLLRRR